MIEIGNSEIIDVDTNKYKKSDYDSDDIDAIDVIDGFNLTYDVFFKKYLLQNKPCIIKNVSNSWDCSHKWIKNGTINCEHFTKTYGDLSAPIADCKTIQFNAHCKSDMKVRDYINYLQNPKRDKLLYLKDWHLKKERPNDTFYEVPDIFASDWLNEFAIDHKEDDFMFVYIGPQNSWTPLHVDVYNSYSWSVNVVGRKKWLFFPPGEENKLKDTFGNLPLLFSAKQFPTVKYIEVIQEQGDALFVPTGWHHEVINILDTISINHNWVNGCNIEAVWESLHKCFLSVENEIMDLKDSSEYSFHCQIILKSLFGMNHNDFLTFICYIGNKRLHQLKTGNKSGLYNFEFGVNQIVFDLKAILKIINLIQHHTLLTNSILSEENNSLITNIKNEIENII